MKCWKIYGKQKAIPGRVNGEGVAKSVMENQLINQVEWMNK